MILHKSDSFPLVPPFDPSLTTPWLSNPRSGYHFSQDFSSLSLCFSHGIEAETPWKVAYHPNNGTNPN